jgi:glycosyltransferase involved in cell wall biosynthesis
MAAEQPPAVSVLLPTHDRPDWLEGALTSVLEGEFTDLEVVVSNNGRPEDTRRLAERIDDPRVRWIEQPPCDLLENYLRALALARGRFVATLHDDDWWHPGLLAALVPPLQADPGVVAAFSDQWQASAEREVDEAMSDFFTRTSGRAALAPGLHRPFGDLAVRETVPIAGCVFRRDAVAVEDFPAEVGPALDVWLGYLLARTGGGAFSSPDRLVFCRMHDQSDSAVAGEENLRAAIGCQRRMLADPQLAPERAELRRRMAGRELWLGGSALRRGERGTARAHLVAALRLRPNVKAVAGWGASWVAPTALLGRL